MLGRSTANRIGPAGEARERAGVRPGARAEEGPGCRVQRPSPKSLARSRHPRRGAVVAGFSLGSGPIKALAGRRIG